MKGSSSSHGSGYKGVSKKKQHSRRAMKAMQVLRPRRCMRLFVSELPLQKKEPQLVEDERTALFMRSTTCSEAVRSLLLDLYRVRPPPTDETQIP
jgi:hypothetical protein